MAVTAPDMSKLCSVYAAAAEQDPIGTGSAITRMMAIELPTPWGENLYASDPDGSVFQRIRAIQMAYFKRFREEGGTLLAGYPTLNGIAPDREWSTPDRRRVLLGTRSEGAISDFTMAEYMFEPEAPEIVDMADAYFNAPERLGEFDRFKTDYPLTREFFVCTHGHVDTCCARFGVPLYQQARKDPRVRAWRMTHFGGHRYAPTAWEFPSAYKRAFLDEQSAGRVLARDGHPADLSDKLRGWSGTQSYVQLLDREGLKRFGWEWTGFRRSGSILESDDEAMRWRVRLEFESPRGQIGAYEGVVGVGRELPDVGCGQHFGERESQSREYVLESFEDLSAR